MKAKFLPRDGNQKRGMWLEITALAGEFKLLLQDAQVSYILQNCLYVA